MVKWGAPPTVMPAVAIGRQSECNRGMPDASAIDAVERNEAWEGVPDHLVGDSLRQSDDGGEPWSNFPKAVPSLNTGAVGKVIQVPDGVSDLAIAPGGAMAYATGAGTVVVGKVQYSYVTPINLAEGVAETPIPLLHGPEGIALTPDGNTAYVTGGLSSGPPIPPDLTALNLASGKVSGTFSGPGGANDIVNATSGGR